MSDDDMTAAEAMREMGLHRIGQGGPLDPSTWGINRPVDLADFLLARIAEDEAAVNDRTRHLTPAGWSYLEQFGDFGDDERWMIEIPAARVLAECDAKRRIVEAYRNAIGVCDFHAARGTQDGSRYQQAAVEATVLLPVLKLIALPYADHPDYREEWRA